ncbi:MAG: glycoside hydrolase family 2 protein [Flavobacteriaceae bacterium]|nr:glycoside hydrolase family 2 protein [Flavobacteriaceae bacterium]
MRKLIFLFSFILMIGCQPKDQQPIEILLDKNWQFTSQNSTSWQPATVPGNVFTDLLAIKKIPDPFIKTNEEKVQWVSDSTWVYQTNFTLTDQIIAKKNIVLEFEGLDTYAKIYINGKYQLDTDNAFRKYSISLKDIPHSKENKLKIIFYPTKSHEESAKKNLVYQLPEGNRIFTRKAQFQYGWDWGPKLNTAGIWKPIKLIAWNDYKLNDVYIKQKSLSTSKAVLEVVLDASITDKKNKQFNYTIYVNNQLQKTYTNTAAKRLTFEIENATLWWPHNIGTPYLYDIRLEVTSENTLVASKTLKKGLRTIELVTEKDSIGESFYFNVNGVPVYAKGANYIPQNSFQNKVTAAHYEKLLSDAVDANMNMLRVWGGGIYENDIFYEKCDEKGILVWQDFMFACAMYPGDIEYLTNVAIEAEEQVKRLRNYASIALWCGNNENSEGWHRWGWQDGRNENEKEEIWSNYLKVFDSILPNTVAKYSQTAYWESSPKYGRGNKKYEFEGDAHDWWVWHDAAPFEHFEKRVPRFMSEFGFQAFPSIEVLQHINQSEKINLKTDAMKMHQKHHRGFQLIDEYMKRDYKVPTNAADYAYVSQLVQAKGITMGIEAHRRAKPYNMGTLYWQLNDCWPAISWSSIDYFGNWKALHYKAKKSFENVLLSTIKNKGSYDTYIVNDSLADLEGKLKLKIIDFYGKEIWSNSKDITVKANSSQKVFTIPTSYSKNKNTVFIVEFSNSTSLYYFAKPKNLSFPKSDIIKSITKTKKGFTIELISNTLQKDVFLHTYTKGKFSDNYFDLLPNQKVQIEFTTTATELTDLEVKSLNSIY